MQGNYDLLSQLTVLEVKTAKGIKFINPLDIFFVKADNKCSDIYLSDNRIIITSYMLKDIEKLLPIDVFHRCHKSYIINCMYFDYYYSNSIVLKGNIRLPLSRSKRLLFVEKLKCFCTKR